MGCSHPALNVCVTTGLRAVASAIRIVSSRSVCVGQETVVLPARFLQGVEFTNARGGAAF
jgi:hypothetical protein